MICLRVWMIVAALALNGCVGTVRDLELQRLGRVSVRQATADLLELDLEIEVYNPHRITAKISDLEYQIAIAGKTLAAGSWSPTIALPARTSSLLDLPVRVRFDQIDTDTFNSLFLDQIPYQLRGTARLLAPLERESVDLELQGFLPAPKGIDLRLNGKGTAPFLTQVTLGSSLRGLVAGRVFVDLAIENPFSFALPIESFEYRVKLAGHTAGHGSVARNTELSPGPNELRLPLQADLARAAAGLVAGALGGGRFDGKIDGEVVLRRGSRRLSIQLLYDPTQPTR